MMEAFWTLLSLFAALRGSQVLWDAYKDLWALGETANGRRRVANEHIIEAWLGVFIYLCSFSGGFIALSYRLEWIGLHLRLEWVPYALIAMLVALVIRQEIRKYSRQRLLRDPQDAENARARETVYDTNKRVRRIEGTLGAEEIDRKEGRDHRGFDDDLES